MNVSFTFLMNDPVHLSVDVMYRSLDRLNKLSIFVLIDKYCNALVVSCHVNLGFCTSVFDLA